MSEKINDGGSVFPEVFTDVKGERGDYTHDTYSAGGMTLRDYFAAKAMQAALAAGEKPALVGAFAYHIADEMLKARKL